MHDLHPFPGTFHVENRIRECWDGRERIVEMSKRRLIVVHRCELGETAEEVARGFRQVAATGGEMPYTFVLGRHGLVEQALRIQDVGPHARRWNTQGIGISLVGDFREQEPTSSQWMSLVALCHILSGWVDGPNAIYGHDELEGGSSDPNKECPGKHLSMDTLRYEVREANLARISFAGIKF